MNEKRSDNLIFEAYQQINEGWPEGTMGPGGGSNDPQVHGADDEERLTPEEENIERSISLAEMHFRTIDHAINDPSRPAFKEDFRRDPVAFWVKHLQPLIESNDDMDIVSYWQTMQKGLTAGYGQKVYFDVTGHLRDLIDELR
tara:strand:- start:496 stop:924 length:429 start_codon:yes stop_codon:yes gene_type:complete